MSFQYVNLNKTQKRLVDAFVQLSPELATASTITRVQIEDLFNQLYSKREESGEKIGYPMWLTKQCRVSRGVYAFPGPNATEVVPTATRVVTTSYHTQEDKDFIDELKEAGIGV